MTIVGVGNLHRGDDAAGLLAAQRIRARQGPWRVLEWSGDMLGVFDAVGPESSVVFIDAVCTGRPAGTIQRWDACAAAPPERTLRCSTHGFSLLTAIELARATGRLPDSVVLYGVEGACFDAGAELTPAVAEAIESVAERVILEVSQHA
jgi:hydrogenase maturation protease